MTPKKSSIAFVHPSCSSSVEGLSVEANDADEERREHDGMRMGSSCRDARVGVYVTAAAAWRRVRSDFG